MIALQVFISNIGSHRALHVIKCSRSLTRILQISGIRQTNLHAKKSINAEQKNFKLQSNLVRFMFGKKLCWNVFRCTLWLLALEIFCKGVKTIWGNYYKNTLDQTKVLLSTSKLSLVEVFLTTCKNNYFDSMSSRKFWSNQIKKQ